MHVHFEEYVFPYSTKQLVTTISFYTNVYCPIPPSSTYSWLISRSTGVPMSISSSETFGGGPSPYIPIDSINSPSSP